VTVTALIVAASAAPRLGIGTNMMVHAASNGGSPRQDHPPEDNGPG
jgi:hypothetical protein